MPSDTERAEMATSLQERLNALHEHIEQLRDQIATTIECARDARDIEATLKELNDVIYFLTEERDALREAGSEQSLAA